MNLKSSLVLGESGFIGSACRRVLKENSNIHLLGGRRVNLADPQETIGYITEMSPAVIINAAGKVAGIAGNIEFPADLMRSNIKVSTSVIVACHEASIKHLIQFASACVYPINESGISNPVDIGSGPIEPTSASYATAKICAMEMAQAHRKQYGYKWTTLIPSNLYGSGDWESGSGGHVTAMLLERFATAKSEGSKSVTVWGDGKSQRNFLHVDDLASAVEYVIENNIWDEGIINICGEAEITIAELAILVREVVGYRGEIIFDHTKPNGARRKMLDDSYIRGLGWRPRIDLYEGLKLYYENYCERT